MSALDMNSPEFTLSIRGYDRLQVDEYVQRLRALLAGAEERARSAESELEFSRHSTIGPRVSQIFDLAVEESKELREQVAEEASALIAAARAEAAEVLEDAHAAAEDLVARTRRDHGGLLDELEAERDHVCAEVQELEERKVQLLGDLRRLRDAIANVAGLGAGADDEPTRRLDDRRRLPAERPQLVAATDGAANGAAA